MSDKSLAVIKTENLELIKENNALKETVTQLLKEIQRLRELEPVTRTTPLESTPEKRIIQVQIEQLDAISQTRALTLEEIRAVDLLIKNQKLVNEKKTKDIEESPDDDNVVELMRIAGDVQEYSTPIVEEPKRSKKQKASNKNPVE